MWPRHVGAHAGALLTPIAIDPSTLAAVQGKVPCREFKEGVTKKLVGS